MIGQFRWTSSRTHLLGWNVWQKPKYKFCVIMSVTHVYTLLRWDVKWFNFCQHTLLAQQCVSIWPQPKGGFPVMAKITRILAANIPRQFFFVITTTASTRCLVQNFQLICYSQRVNATSQYNDSGSSRCSKWPKDRMVAVVKHCWLLVQGKEATEKDDQRQLLDRCSRKYWHVR